MELIRNIPSTLKARIEYHRQGQGFCIYEYQNRQTVEHGECMDAKVWDWPHYAGGACESCEEMFRALWEDHIAKITNDLAGRLHYIGIGKRHHDCTVDNFEGPDSVKKVCNEVAKNPADLVLTGAPGTGKTHLAAAIVRKLLLEGKIFKVTDPSRSIAIFKTVPDLLSEIRQTFNVKSRDEDEVIDRLSRIPLLVLDDLGAEKPSEWVTTTLYAIIDSRYREMKPTIVTSNLSLNQIASQLHERIASRLSAGKVVKLTGPDRRGKRS